MVEGQEGLEPRSLRPCHRLDRCTSGLTICATSPAVARLMQGRMEGGAVKKLYVARVTGSFPSWEDSSDGLRASAIAPSAVSSWNWGGNDSDSAYIEVNAPIENIDPINGIRAVRDSGKPSKSRFRLIAHDETTNVSLIACYPVTGRGHQLRVHLQHIGFPIVGDCQYGGSDVAGSGTSTGTDSLKEVAKQAIAKASNASTASTTSTNSTNAIQPDQAKAAKEICKCCNGGEEGVTSSFNSAQLLGGGHAIDLHAFRYQVTFERKASKKRKKRQKLEKDSTNPEEDSSSILATLEFSTNLPAWAKACETISWL